MKQLKFLQRIPQIAVSHKIECTFMVQSGVRNVTENKMLQVERGRWNPVFDHAREYHAMMKE